MRVRQLSGTGDMTFGQSALNFLVNSPQCVAQVVLTSLELWQGEWSFDTSQGCPYLQAILGKQSQSTADLAVQDYVLGIQGVSKITAYESVQNRTTRNFLSQLTILSQFSGQPVTVVGPNVPPGGNILLEDGSDLVTEGGSDIVTENF